MKHSPAKKPPPDATGLVVGPSSRQLAAALADFRALGMVPHANLAAALLREDR